ncbi:MAG TPA: hypothetical protein VFR33_02925 [Candidatus Dormibacteraeota bacterium]|nr:hypothetical protein [Candidatus Dormibacteraeota bacterium]
MEASEPEPDFSIEIVPTRILRATAVIAASLIAIVASAIFYTDPQLASFARKAAFTAPKAQASYRISAIAFVDAATGWIVADFSDGGFAVLHTDDGGATWIRQLTGRDAGRAHYLRFFDSAAGVLGEVGTAAQLYRTVDGGATWMHFSIPDAKGRVLSWSFVDPYYGWALVSGTTVQFPLPTYLYRTDDGGHTWQALGLAAPSPDQVFEVNFTYLTTGWLSSANSGPYVYRTDDVGRTWTRVPLPPPSGGWPSGGTFLVAVNPTSGGGVTATVVFFPTLQGRKGQGAKIRDFPPLTVRAYDGGRPVTYFYAPPVGSVVTTSVALAVPPNQTELATQDNGKTWSTVVAPSPSGAVGYLDSRDWWWVGPGQWASTRDGGTTWTTPAGIDVQQPLPGTLQIVDRLHAWLIGTLRSRSVLEATADGGRHWRLVSLPATPPAAGDS